MAKLYIFHKNGRSDFQLADHNVVGRHPKNRIKVLEPGVSKVHCLISLEGDGEYTIRDLGSRNGTFVNGKRIVDRRVLADGDEILLGNTRCLFREEIAEAVIQLVSDPDAVHRIRQKISPLRLNKFFPEANIIDEEMLRADYERLRIAFELSRDIGFDLHVDFILSRVLDRSNDVLDFDFGIVLLTGEDGSLRPQSYKLKRLEDRITLSQELLDHVREEQKGVLVSTGSVGDGSVSASPSDREVCSLMVVPILFEMEFLGVLVVQRSTPTRSYGERELHLLSNVANKSAAFIRNSQIAKRVTRESLERERYRKIVSPEMAEMMVAGQVRVTLKGEARPATVVVAGIRNDAAISEFAEPEALLEALNAYFGTMVDPVFRLEGMVVHYLGDRLVAAWGVPLGHEDDPMRAVQAALEMRRLVAAHNRNLQEGPIRSFQIGVGIDSGSVIAGQVGSGWTSRLSVVGDILNTADALAASAEAGQIVVSENTFFIVRRLFNTRALEGVGYRGGWLTRYEILGDRSAKAGTPWTHLG